MTKHPKAMTLFIGSAITLVTAIGLLEQHEVYATNGANSTSANGANGLKGANGPSAPGANGTSANGANGTSANGANGTS
ncbi:MAG: hypothetical protein M3P08_12220, partial [Thermoproteota archaeon]|nr:hypothetical protein [Thermoproteota archaeon]